MACSIPFEFHKKGGQAIFTNNDKPKLNDEKSWVKRRKPWKYSCRWKPTGIASPAKRPITS
jgi:hypothetical protein